MYNRLNLKQDFECDSRGKLKKKRPAPFSLRLSTDERKRLLREANGTPLGTHIRSALFNRSSAAGPVAPDKKDIARALGKLGQSELSSNLAELANAAKLGALPVSPEIETELSRAASEVAEIKSLLMAALGIKER